MGVESILPCGPCNARASGICSGVARRNLARLAGLAQIVEVGRRQTLIQEGMPGEHFCTLILGSAKLFKLLPDGRRQIVGFAYPGSFLGMAPDGRYAFGVEALEPIRICRLSPEMLCSALEDFRAVERRLLAIATRDLIQAQEHVLLLGRKTMMERIASFLLDQAARPQPRSVRWPRIRLPMSRIDIADYLGVTVETISRTLAKLKQRRVIAVPNVHELVILDPSGLEELAEGNGSDTTESIES
jgi:CRP/FNR family transcriptional regulator, anaerobic regulatory protein